MQRLCIVTKIVGSTVDADLSETEVPMHTHVTHTNLISLSNTNKHNVSLLHYGPALFTNYCNVLNCQSCEMPVTFCH